MTLSVICIVKIILQHTIIETSFIVVLIAGLHPAVEVLPRSIEHLQSEEHTDGYGVPVYEEVLLQSTSDAGVAIELEKNIAYCTSQS